MANPDRPRGFRPVGSASGGEYTGPVFAVRSLAADRSSDTTENHGDIYIGDPINIDTSGVVTPANSNVAVSGGAVGFGPSAAVQFGAVGSVNEPAMMFDPRDLTKRYLKYDELGYVYYVPVGGTFFEVQSAS